MKAQGDEVLGRWPKQMVRSPVQQHVRPHPGSTRNKGSEL